jgi:Protein of unknown function (DUF2939)
MSRSLKVAVVAVLALLVAWYAASPYIAFQRMRDAAERNDAEAFSAYIDFPAVRESLKTALNAKMMAEVGEASDDNPLAGAGAAFAMRMMSPMIDAMVSPQGIMLMMQGRKLGGRWESTAAPSATSAPPRELTVSSGYTDLNTFDVSVGPHDDAATRFGLRFKRQGLFSWKLTSIDIPM